MQIFMAGCEFGGTGARMPEILDSRASFFRDGGVDNRGKFGLNEVLKAA